MVFGLPRGPWEVGSPRSGMKEIDTPRHTCRTCTESYNDSSKTQVVRRSPLQSRSVTCSPFTPSKRTVRTVQYPTPDSAYLRYNRLEKTHCTTISLDMIMEVFCGGWLQLSPRPALEAATRSRKVCSLRYLGLGWTLLYLP